MRNFLGRIRERGGMCVRGGDKISLDPIDSINLDPENFHPRFFSPLLDSFSFEESGREGMRESPSLYTVI